MRTRLFLSAIAILGMLAVSCTPTQRGAGTGAAAGAALGAIIADGDNHAEGALIGAAAGAATGAVISKRQQQKKQAQTSPYYY